MKQSEACSESRDRELFAGCNHTELYQLCRRAGAAPPPTADHDELVTALLGLPGYRPAANPIDTWRLSLMDVLIQHRPVLEHVITCPAKTSGFDPRACFQCPDQQVFDCLVGNPDVFSEAAERYAVRHNRPEPKEEIEHMSDKITLETAPRKLDELARFHRYLQNNVLRELAEKSHEQDLDIFPLKTDTSPDAVAKWLVFAADMPKEKFAENLLPLLQAYDEAVGGGKKKAKNGKAVAKVERKQPDADEEEEEKPVTRKTKNTTASDNDSAAFDLLREVAANVEGLALKIDRIEETVVKYGRYTTIGTLLSLLSANEVLGLENTQALSAAHKQLEHLKAFFEAAEAKTGKTKSAKS